MFRNLNKVQSLLVVAMFYAIAFAAAQYVLTQSLDYHPLWQMAIADLVATVVIFAASAITRNSSMYDAYWSVFPIYATWVWYESFGAAGDPVRNMLVAGLVAYWGIRLTANWARGWPGFIHEDWRYEKLADDSGKAYWLVSFLGIHLFPTVMVFLGLVPVYYVLQDPIGIGPADYLAGIITFIAITIEFIADEQQKIAKRSGQQIATKGLWAWSRHPNYFGEIMFWVGLVLFLKDPFSNESWWKLSGAVVMILLFSAISIPMMEKRQLQKDGYKEYQQRTSSLIPMPPKRG